MKYSFTLRCYPNQRPLAVVGPQIIAGRQSEINEGAAEPRLRHPQPCPMFAAAVF